MHLTDWYPCSIKPCRDGWYDLERRLNYGSVIHSVERVRFKDGSWDRLSCESKMAVWVGMDYWRGVTKPEGESK